MGTSLTGTKPKDTYDSLIKVTDNGPISGTAKYLSDGLGNDLPIAVSTSNVGIGTSSPSVKLDVAGQVKAAGIDYHTFSVDQGSAQIRLERTGTSTGVNYIGSDNRGLVILNSAFTNIATFTANGLTFNGDTAAANALDDYEEGTFTATLKGSSSDPSTPVTTTANYTKIGRQVTVSVMFANVNTTGASGSVTVSGLPFSCVTAGVGPAITENFTFGLTRTSVSSFVDSAVATTIRLFVSGNDTSFENLSHNAGTGRYLYTSLTYFV